MNYDLRKKRVSEICDRLKVLLEKEANPEREMRYLLGLLQEAEITTDLPMDNPFAFTLNLEEAILDSNPDLVHLPESLQRFEDAESLVLSLLPGNGDLD
jgi:hypothetical protein